MLSNRRSKIGFFLLFIGLMLGLMLLGQNYILATAQNSERVGLLEKQVKTLENQVVQLSSTSSKALQSPGTPGIPATGYISQEDVVTQAVAAINPSVVSIKVARSLKYRGGTITQR